MRLSERVLNFATKHMTSIITAVTLLALIGGLSVLKALFNLIMIFV